MEDYAVMSCHCKEHGPQFFMMSCGNGKIGHWISIPVLCLATVVSALSNLVIASLFNGGLEIRQKIGCFFASIRHCATFVNSLSSQMLFQFNFHFSQEVQFHLDCMHLFMCFN
jgi:hypothetical protein